MSRIPKNCPVTVLHLDANLDAKGNPRRCFVIRDHKGRHVETLDEGYRGTGELSARWPWTNWSVLAEYFDSPSDACIYPTPIDVAPSEYKRFLRMEGDEHCASLRAMGDRNERRAKKLASERYR